MGVAVQGDVTSWLYDEASNCMTNKVYADGKGPSYDYDANGRLAKRTWARGIVTDYSYDNWGSLINTVYSDGTPTISLTYDALGRQISAHDAAGVTTFLYDSFGSLTSETVIGVAGTNMIERFYDAFGRDAGYALNGVRQSTLGYDPATGRLMTMQIGGGDGLVASNEMTNAFTWNYLPGSDLKFSLTYPNGLTTNWTYGNRGELLEVDNTLTGGSVSKYVYIYDAVGRRVACAKSGSAFTTPDTYAYRYNARSELTNATASVDAAYRYGYAFDDIGNRESSSERGTNSVFAANSLNQYTSFDAFVPQYDEDGNQTLVKTATGVWSVTYNGENRPVLWAQGTTTISMSFDRMGRRVTRNDRHFVYDGYLQIADNAGYAYVWDSTESIATRPLVWRHDGDTLFYTHDGNKNVSEVIAADGSVSAHYEYAPFGALTVSRGTSAATNPFRFSSEYAEDDTATVYYNYRHYEPVMGRWLGRDPIGERGGSNLFSHSHNSLHVDWLGLKCKVGAIRNRVVTYEFANSLDNGINSEAAESLSESINDFSYLMYAASIGCSVSAGGAAIAAGCIDCATDKGYSDAHNTSGTKDICRKMREKLASAYPRMRGRLSYEKCVCKSFLFFRWTTWEKVEIGPTDWHKVEGGTHISVNPNYPEYETQDEAKELIDQELYRKLVGE